MKMLFLKRIKHSFELKGVTSFSVARKNGWNSNLEKKRSPGQGRSFEEQVWESQKRYRHNYKAKIKQEERWGKNSS